MKNYTIFKESFRKKSLLCFVCILFSINVFGQEYEYPYSSFKEHDPLKPLVNERGEILIKDKKEMGDFLLQGIISSSDGSQAVINNDVFKEGDIFEGYTIKKIDAYKVIFEKEGEEFILNWEG